MEGFGRSGVANGPNSPSPLRTRQVRGGRVWEAGVPRIECRPSFPAEGEGRGGREAEGSSQCTVHLSRVGVGVEVPLGLEEGGDRPAWDHRAALKEPANHSSMTRYADINNHKTNHHHDNLSITNDAESVHRTKW